MSDTAEPRATADVAALDADERAELLLLRTEVETLRAATDPQRWTMRWRAPAAAVLIVLGCVFAPITITAVWAHNQVTNTDRFVTTMSPLVRDPSVRAALTDRITNTVFHYVDVPALANEAVDAVGRGGLPPAVVDRLRGLTGPLATSVQGFVHGKVGDLVASPPFAAIWDQVIRVAHEQVDNALSGRSSALTVSNGKVLLDLGPFIAATKQQLVASGFTVANVIPAVHPTVAVLDARTLTRATTAYHVLNTLATWLPWLTLLLLAGGCYLARRHRRAMCGSGVGVAASMVVLAGALLVVRGVIVGGVPNRSAPATAATYDIVVQFLRLGLRTAFAVGVVVALGAFLTGPSTTAVRIRHGLTAGLAWLRRYGARAGWRGSRVGAWVHTYRVALRIAALAVAVLVFVSLDRPSGLTVLLIAVLLVVCLGVIQFLDLAPAQAGSEPGDRRRR